MSDKRTSLQNSFWSILDNFSQQALAFVIFTVLAHWLTPQEFGLLAIAHLIVQFVRLAILDALALPILRNPQIDTVLYSWLFTQCTCAGLLCAALMAAAAPALAGYFQSPQLLNVLWGMSLVIVLYALGRAHDAMLLRQARFRLVALRSLLSVTAGGTVAIVMAHRGAGAMALVAQQLTTTGIILLISLGAEWSFWRPRWHFSLHLLRRYRRECLKVGVSAMLTYANGNGDAALVSVIFGPHATGIYNLAKRVTSAISLMIAASVSRVASALFFGDSHRPERLRQHYRHMSGLVLAGLILIYGLLANLAEPVIRIVFGPQWLTASPLLLILGIGSLFQALFNIGQTLSLATRHGTRAVRLGALQATTAVSLALLLQSLQLPGVAAGFAAAAVLSAITMHRLVTAQIGLRWWQTALQMTPALLALLALTVGIRITTHHLVVDSWLSLITTNAIGGAAFVVTFTLALGVIRWRRRSV